MAAYCTKADIIDLLSEETLIRLTDDEGAGVMNDSRVEKAVADADAEIDGYCGARYDLPFATVPVIIRKCSVDMAVYNLYSRRLGAPEDRAMRYNNAVKLLREIASGNVTLGTSPQTETEGNDEVEAEYNDRVFTQTTLENF